MHTIVFIANTAVCFIYFITNCMCFSGNYACCYLKLKLESHGSMAPVAEHHVIGSEGWFLSVCAVITDNGPVIETIGTTDHKHL